MKLCQGVAFGDGLRCAGGNLKRLPSVVSIARALVSLAEKHAVEMPLTDALVAISDGTNPLEAVGALMARKAQWETR